MSNCFLDVEGIYEARALETKGKSHNKQRAFSGSCDFKCPCISQSLVKIPSQVAFLSKSINFEHENFGFPSIAHKVTEYRRRCPTKGCTFFFFYVLFGSEGAGEWERLI